MSRPQDPICNLGEEFFCLIDSLPNFFASCSAKVCAAWQTVPAALPPKPTPGFAQSTSGVQLEMKFDARLIGKCSESAKLTIMASHDAAAEHLEIVSRRTCQAFKCRPIHCWHMLRRRHQFLWSRLCVGIFMR